MATLAEAREALADVVTAAGLACLPYPPDNPAPPIAFVDDLGVDFTGSTGGGSFCLPGSALATVVTIAQRNDRPGSMAYLEALVPQILSGLYSTPGVRVISAASGQITVGGQELPSVTYTVQFQI